MGFMFVIYFRSRILLHIWVVAVAGQPGSAAEIACEVSASASSLTQEGATESAPSHPDDHCLPRGDFCPVQELELVFSYSSMPRAVGCHRLKGLTYQYVAVLFPFT